MITKYFSKVVVRFNPFGKEGKSARLFLASIPPSLRGACAIKQEVIPHGSTVSPIVEVSFKDKKVIEADPATMNIDELHNLFDRHSRKLKLQDSIQA